MLVLILIKRAKIGTLIAIPEKLLSFIWYLQPVNVTICITLDLSKQLSDLYIYKKNIFVYKSDDSEISKINRYINIKKSR